MQAENLRRVVERQRLDLLDVAVISTFVLRDVVIVLLVHVEVERLEGVEDEVAKVLLHVGVQDAAVEEVDRMAAVHHLRLWKVDFDSQNVGVTKNNNFKWFSYLTIFL